MKVASKMASSLIAGKIQYRAPRSTFMSPFSAEETWNLTLRRYKGPQKFPLVWQLQSFLGMLNFIQSYIPHLWHLTAPLQEVLKKNQVFYWDDNTSTAFKKHKSFISQVHSTPLLYYQIDMSITVQADANKHGLHTCILQHCKHITYASKSLMGAEAWYANIKLELLAILNCCIPSSVRNSPLLATIQCHDYIQAWEWDAVSRYPVQTLQPHAKVCNPLISVWGPYYFQ